MVRDHDVIRQILLEVQAAPANQIPDLKLEGIDPDTALEHLELMIEDGLIEGKIAPSRSGGRRLSLVIVERMTTQGHAFIENARNDQVWQQTKKKVAEKGGALSFEIVKALVVQGAKDLVGLSG